MLQFKGPVSYTDSSRMASGSATGVCGVRPGKRLSFFYLVCMPVFQAEIPAILACTKECVGRAYRGKHIYISDCILASYYGI
jgi:hypothetical protein